jgi:hypothetical protein
MSDVADPFGERVEGLLCRWHRVLGQPVCFESEHDSLLRLADQAFALANPPRPVAGAVRVRLRLGSGDVRRQRVPPAPRLFSGDGLLGCVMGRDDFALVQPELRRACVSVSPALLAAGYHARYELLEFATLTLLSRVFGLVPLHAASFGRGGRAVLVLGNSGTGKSTTCLAALAAGLQLVSEDSVFVTPRGLTAAGLSAYLHLQSGSLRFAPPNLARQIRRAPRIRRRGGAVKFEFDLRRTALPLAAGPQTLAALVCLSRRSAGDGPALRPLSRSRAAAILENTQPYARGQAGWKSFGAAVMRLPRFEMRRAEPQRALEEIRQLLERERP